ncbi:RmlD substrate binding domain [Balamuthia mandrillaris]
MKKGCDWVLTAAVGSRAGCASLLMQPQSGFRLVTTSPSPSSMLLRSTQAFPQKRELHVDLHGGRSSVSGVVASVFGATGFVGRYVVNRLGKIGSQVVIPYRGEEKAYRHLKTMGDLGQIVPIWYAIRDYESVKRAMQHSNVVINLVGRNYETRNFTLEDVHVHGAATIARAAKEVGIERLIHVSAANASETSSSHWLRTKAAGEKAVKQIFPEATILRPTPMFGLHDWFVMRYTRLAKYWPFYPLILPDHKVQPLWAGDMGTALMNALASNDTKGKTYELGGPTIYTNAELADLILDTTLLKKPVVHVPYAPFAALTSITDKVFRLPKFTYKELEAMRAGDQVVDRKAHPLGIEELGVEHRAEILDITRNALRDYRQPGHLGEF